MALNYYGQSELEALAKKAPGATPAGFPARFADTSAAVFGGSRRSSGELQYLRNQNLSATGVDEKDSDAWHKFVTGKGVVGSRADQEKREFFITKAF